MDTTKKMYKVLTAVQKKGGGTYWLRLGTAFTNRDDSINLYLDAVPAPTGNSYHLQIRELDADDLRRRETASGAANGNGTHAGGGGGGGYARDLGGIGAGPSLSRAVTGASSNPDEIPF